ncbi:hypothetical protein BVX98_06230 [bacterium F11]|nr:hypothetical protein BVX98_06230 [bacterium F11]
MNNRKKSTDLFQGFFLLLTLFFTGAAILAIEIVGARLLGPYFGVGLFVWSSLITVTLITLSLGYWLGGKMADHIPELEVLYFLVFLAGLLILPIPLVAPWVIEKSLLLGIRSGSLLSGIVLFGAPLFVLGMVSPYSVKMYTPKLDLLGTSVGQLYAISTVGSCFGSILTGFLLVPYLGVSNIFYLLAFGLFVLWGIRMFFHRGIQAITALIPILVSFMLFFSPPIPVAATKGTTILMESNSLLGQLQVEDKKGYRILRIDGAPNSIINKKTGLSFFDYTTYLELMPFLRPHAKKALLVGLGGGSVAKRFSSYGLQVDAVEIDPTVVWVAKRFFDYDPGKGKIVIQDGRRFFQSTKETYDFVILDVSSGDLAPSHLFSLESLTELKSIIRDKGVLGINFIGHIKGPDTRAAQSLYRTLEEVFAHIGIYPLKPDGGIGNIIFLASDETMEVRQSLQECSTPHIRTLLQKMVSNRILDFNSKEGMILRDNFNPLQVWSTHAAKDWREQIRHPPESL